MKYIIVGLLFIFALNGCKTKTETPDTPAKKPIRVKTKSNYEERSVCGSIKKWESTGWYLKCEESMEGGEFDALALAVCDKVSNYFDTPEEPLRCLEQIKGTEYKKAEYNEEAIGICEKLAKYEKTKYDAIWCLGVIKNKKYSTKTIMKSLKYAKPGMQSRKSLYFLDTEGTKF